MSNIFEKYGDEPTIMDAIAERNKNTRTTWVTLGASNHTEREREPNDFYESPRETIDRLLASDDLRPDVGNLVWECACGRGALSVPLQEAGYTTYDTDLIDRGFGIGGTDFLKSERPFSKEKRITILTNPPFSKALQFAQHAIDLLQVGERAYFIFRLSFLEGQKREKWFNSGASGLRYVAVFGKRITCNKCGVTLKSTGAVAYAWFVFEKGFTGRPEILWI